MDVSDRVVETGHFGRSAKACGCLLRRDDPDTSSGTPHAPHRKTDLPGWVDEEVQSGGRSSSDRDSILQIQTHAWWWSSSHMVERDHSGCREHLVYAVQEGG